MTANGRIHISEKSNPEISINTSQFLTKVKADPLYHNEGENIDLKNNKITTLKEGTEKEDAVNFYQLEGKVDLTTHARLQQDVTWLENNHVTPNQYQSVLTELGTKVDKSSITISNLNSLLTRIQEVERKLQNMKAVYMITHTGTLTNEEKQEHLLTEINANRMILNYQFYFQTSDGSEWHDLKTAAIVGVLSFSYVTTKILGSKKYIYLYTHNTDWKRKPIFSNYYSLNYRLEYVYTE